MKECPICHTCFGDSREICNNDQSLLLDLIPGLPIIDNKYRLDKKIGIGRVGMVFQATMMQTGQVVAIKIISPNLVTADPSLPERFLTLIQACASLDHVNIVKIFDFGQTEPNILYLVMEYLPGSTLAEMLQQQKQLSLELALSITSKVCEAIANANRNNVYHLDLKPSNIFAYSNETGQQMVKVVDFGIVRLKAPSLMSQLSPMQRDYVLGKPYYFAPEQFNSEQIDPRSEVYSIGAILYHLLAGNPPFTGGSYPMLKMQHMGVTPPSLREIRAEIPPTLESIIIKALEKRSTQRHSSVIALAIQLSAQLSKHKDALLNQSNNTIATSQTPQESFYSNTPSQIPINQYTSKSVSDNTLPALPSPPEPYYSSDPTPAPIMEKPRSLSSFSAFKLDDTLTSLPTIPEPFYSSDPTPAPITSYSPSYVSNDTLGTLPDPPEPYYSSDPTPAPITNYSPSYVKDNTLAGLPDLPDKYYSGDPTPAPTKYSPSYVSNNTLGSLPDPPEPYYSSDPTPAPTIENRRSLAFKIEEALEDFPTASKASYAAEPMPTITTEKSISAAIKLDDTLGSFPDPPESFYSNDPTPSPDTDTVYSEQAKDNVKPFNKPYGATEPVYSVPGLVAPTLLITEGNIVTRPLASESFYIGEEFDEISNPNNEEMQIFEQVDIDQAFQEAGIGETAERTSISKFLEFSVFEKSQSSFSKQDYQLSPTALIYLFAEQFVPALLSGQRGRLMHNNFSTERERLAALLLTSSLFSLSCREAIEISVGNGGAQKKQIAFSQKNEGFIVRGVNLEIPILDILESKIIDSLKLTKDTRFYNIFLYIAQTSVATSEREAICEIVTDMVADELAVHRFLQSKQRTRKLESGESAIQYELACDLTPYRNQAISVQEWLLGLQQQAAIELAGKPVQPFIHILKYYTDLFRHNSKELSKS